MSAQEAYHHGMVNAVVPKDGGRYLATISPAVLPCAVHREIFLGIGDR